MDRDTFRFYINDGVITSEDVLALFDGEEAWSVQYDYTYIPVNIDEMVAPEIPSTAVGSHYFMSANGEDSGIVKIYVDGDNYYFNNIFGNGYTFKGTLDSEGRIRVEIPQLVSAESNYIYLNTCDITESYEYLPGESDCFYFDIDDDGGFISNSSVNLALFSGNKYIYGYTTLENIEFLKFLPEEEPISVPDGATVLPYAMNSGYDEQGNHTGGLMSIARDGNDFYFIRMDLSHDDIIMKGVLDPATNIISIDLSQVIGINGSRFMGLAAAKQSIVTVEDYYDDDYNEIRYVVDDDLSTIDMKYDPATESITCDDVLAVIDASRRKVSSSFIKPTYFPVNEIAKAPEQAVASQYTFVSDGDVNSASIVTISRDGDNFYFQHPDDVCFLGTLTPEGKISVAVPQLVNTGSRNEGVFLRVGTSERVGTPDDVDLQYRSWRIFTDEEGVDELLFDFNEGLNTISCSDGFSIVHLNNCMVDMSATNFTYNTYLVGAFTPANPYELEVADKTEDYWGNGTRYCFSFVIPCYDTENRYIPYDNISYRIYFDDEVFTFTPEEYPLTFTTDVIDVPFNHPATSEITHAIWNDNMRRVYLYNLPEHRLGVQSSYTYEDETKSSEIVYINVEKDGLGLNLGDGRQVKDVEYFDLSDRRVSCPAEGFYLMRLTFSDGSTSTSKVKL